VRQPARARIKLMNTGKPHHMLTCMWAGVFTRRYGHQTETYTTTAPLAPYTFMGECNECQPAFMGNGTTCLR
jgi:hypothetical protein